MLLTAAALTGFFSHAAAAQQGRHFENAWFWGVKGGGTAYQHATVGVNAAGEPVVFNAETHNAPFLGLDWMITRTYGGMYVSYDQGFFEERTGYLLDSSDPASPVAFVDVKNSRRVNFAAMVFPPVNRWVRPYAGLGVSFLQISRTETLNPEVFADQAQFADFEDAIGEHRTQFQPVGIIGVQGRLRPFSVFGQATITQLTDAFLLRGGRSGVFTYEVGIRYNIGSSIDRD